MAASMVRAPGKFTRPENISRHENDFVSKMQTLISTSINGFAVLASKAMCNAACILKLTVLC